MIDYERGKSFGIQRHGAVESTRRFEEGQREADCRGGLSMQIIDGMPLIFSPRIHIPLRPREAFIIRLPKPIQGIPSRFGKLEA